MACQVGDRVDAGQPLAYLLHRDTGVDDAAQRVGRAYSIGDEPPPARALVLEAMR